MPIRSQGKVPELIVLCSQKCKTNSKAHIYDDATQRKTEILYILVAGPGGLIILIKYQ